MTFFAFGFNHERAPVKLRERFSLAEPEIRSLYRDCPLSGSGELMVLSTCNRTEVYLYGADHDADAVQAWMADHAGLDWPGEQAFRVQDETAVRHVLHVTSGLKSLVLGDAQIFSQVKEAYRVAVEEDVIGPSLHRLLHTAFRTAKRVINETGLGAGSSSVSSMAVASALAHFEAHGMPGFADKRVLVVGAGQMGRLALEALTSGAVGQVAVTNRTPARAQALAAPHGIDVVAWADRYEAVAAADLIIVATGADAPVIDAGGLSAARSPRLFIDISVPRNVDPAVDALPDHTVLDLDYLNRWIVQAEVARRAARPEALRVCDDMLAEFVAWVFHHQALQPAIQAIRDTFESIRAQEIDRHHGRLSAVDRDELDRITSSIIQKLLAVPVVRLKNVNPNSIDYVRGIKLLHALFSRPDCDDPSAMPFTPGAMPPAHAAGDPGPASCPFEPPKVDLGDVLSAEERLHAALRLFREDDPRGGAQA